MLDERSETSSQEEKIEEDDSASEDQDIFTESVGYCLSM